MRERILETMDRLFYSEGVRAVGVDTIAEAAGISKRTLYNYFPSKDEMIEAYLARRFHPDQVTDDPPALQILAHFERVERSIKARGFRGCPFVNAVTELGGQDHEACRIAQRFKNEQRLWVRQLLSLAGASEVDLLATQIAALIDGAVISALVRKDASVPNAAREAARTLMMASGVRM